MPTIIHASSRDYSPAELKVIEGLDSPLPLVLLTRRENFVFNEELKKLDKYVLVNLCEFGHDFPFTKTPIFGMNTGEFPDLFLGDEWRKFDDWVTNNTPMLTFQREILEKDLWYDIKTIEYPNWQPSFPIQSKDEFYNRPIDVCFFWGRSHEKRPLIHAEIWEKSGEMGWAVCDSPYTFNEFIRNEHGKKAVTFNLPHYSRIPLDQLLIINGMSKFSISAKGCGVKCFRSTGEANVNSIVCMEHDALAWTYPFIDRVNCIKYYNNPTHAIKVALEHLDLYEIYLAGMETAEKYRWPNYKVHIENIINSVV